MTTLKQLQALVDAGDKATQGEWHKHVYGFNGIMSSNTVIFDAYECVNEENQRFITLAANSRPAIKAAIAEIEAKDKEIKELKYDLTRYMDIANNEAAEVERLRRALEKIAIGKGYYGAQAFEYKNIATQALKACETTERSEDNDE